MSAGPRYHGPKMWARDRGDAVHWALRTLAQAFGDGGRRPDWRDASRQHPPRWRPTRKEPRWFAGAPQRRPFQGSREPGYWRPRDFREERQSNWQPDPMKDPCNGSITIPHNNNSAQYSSDTILVFLVLDLSRSFASEAFLSFASLPYSSSHELKHTSHSIQGQALRETQVWPSNQINDTINSRTPFVEGSA